MATPNSELSKDTRRLDPSELSKDEVVAIQLIEDRLRQAQFTDLDEARNECDAYLAFTEDRHPRVLLLDGARGTGKTSLMLTLVKRWHYPELEREKFNLRAEQVGLAGVLANPPRHIKVLDIMDFDPLPPGMPLIAALVQAWRPIIAQYDALRDGKDRGEDGDDDLIYEWHDLFAMAAAGWTHVSTTKGLIEQVLDREEQVKDWQDLDRRWRALIDRIISIGKRVREPHQLDAEPVFVVMIDDCDLQVDRVRELLPAIRLLYHPRVFFLVSADRPHMIDMLRLDFLGQQNRLAHCSPSESGLASAQVDRWAVSLADASFEKVFPLRNRFHLRKLSLSELLSFKITERSLHDVLNQREQEKEKVPSRFRGLGSYLEMVAQSLEGTPDIPRIWTYRTAHQILEGALGRAGVDHEDASTVDHYGVAEAIGRLLARGEYADLVQIYSPKSESERTLDGSAHAGPASSGQSIVPAGTSLNNEAGRAKGTVPEIDYLEEGRLEAFFPRELTQDISQGGEIVLSSRPHFRYPIDEETRKTSALIAVSLQDDGFGVNVPRLQWDARLALVWTRLTIENYELALHWTRYRHPSPLRLLHWAREWRKFILGIQQLPDQRADRIGYAWIYYQLKWMADEGLDRDIGKIVSPLTPSLSLRNWGPLLRCAEVAIYEDEKAEGTNKGKWRTKTLPLLARPEIGLSPPIQKQLLADVKTAKDKKWLKDERRRLITEALLVAAEESGGEKPKEAYDARVVDWIVSEATARQRSMYKGQRLWWDEVVEGKSAVRKKSQPGRSAEEG